MIRLRFDESKIWQNFQITFSNGYTVSIGIGSAHYCQNRINDANDNPVEDYSMDCEIAIKKPNGKFLPYKGDAVQGYVFPDRVAEIIAYAKSLEPNNYGRVKTDALHKL